MTTLKKIWSYDTAGKVATAKAEKYGAPFTVVEAEGGGFHVVPVEAPAEMAYCARCHMHAGFEWFDGAWASVCCSYPATQSEAA